MNIKTKLLLSIGLLTGMIILLVSLSVIYLQMLTAAEPDSPIASTGLKQAVVWVAIIGGICHSLRYHISYLASSIDK